MVRGFDRLTAVTQNTVQGFVGRSGFVALKPGGFERRFEFTLFGAILAGMLLFL